MEFYYLMSKLYIHAIFHHYDNGEINVTCSGNDMLNALKCAFNLAIGTELRDEHFDAASEMIFGSKSIEDLQKLEINYNRHFYRRVIKFCRVSVINSNDYNTLTKANEFSDSWAF